jgi:plasmid stability protein
LSDSYCAVNAVSDSIDSMGTLTIRKLDERVKAKLRVRAAENGRSMEDEVRGILAAAVSSSVEKPTNVYAAIRQRLAQAGIVGVDLSEVERGPMREPVAFD